MSPIAMVNAIMCGSGYLLVSKPDQCISIALLYSSTYSRIRYDNVSLLFLAFKLEVLATRDVRDKNEVFYFSFSVSFPILSIHHTVVCRIYNSCLRKDACFT